MPGVVCAMPSWCLSKRMILGRGGQHHLLEREGVGRESEADVRGMPTEQHPTWTSYASYYIIFHICSSLFILSFIIIYHSTQTNEIRASDSPIHFDVGHTQPSTSNYRPRLQESQSSMWILR
jgi:hypothetical protein